MSGSKRHVLQRLGATAFVGVVSAGALLSTAGISAADPGITPYGQLPGVDYAGTVVITDSDSASVVVDDVNVETGQVTGTVTNDFAAPLVCQVPGANGEKFNNAVTNSGLVGLAFDFYRNNVILPDGDFHSGTGAATVEAPMGSVYGFFPSGSLGELLDDKAKLRVESNQAKLAGEFGTVTPMTVAAGATSTWTSQLSPSTTGERADFDAAALFYCTADGKSYVFAGDENGEVPPAPKSSPNPIASLAGSLGGSS